MTFQTLRVFVSLLIGRFVATRCPQVAAALTYTTLLAIVPLVTVSVVLFSNFPAFHQLGSALNTFLQANVLPGAAGDIVTAYALQFSEKATQLTLIGTAILIVTVLLLLNMIDGVFNAIWGVRQARPLLTRVTVYWVAITLGPVALAGSVFATGRLVTTSIAYVGQSAYLDALTGMLVPLGLLTAFFSFLYFAVPNHPVRLLHALAGGFAAAFAFLAMQRMFGTIIALMPTYTLVYGTFAVMPIFLLWLYASWVIVLLGAILAATFPEFFERKRVVHAFPGDRAWAALNMLVALADGQTTGRPLDFDTLHDKAGVSHDEAESLLGEMREAGWVVHTEDEMWVLSRRSDQLGMSEIIQRFALSPAGWVDAAPGSVASRAAAHLRQGLAASDVSLAALAGSSSQAEDQIG